MVSLLRNQIFSLDIDRHTYKYNLSDEHGEMEFAQLHNKCEVINSRIIIFAIRETTSSLILE